MAILRRRRLVDGSFGELEKVFNGETDKEKVIRLEDDNAELLFKAAMSEMEQDFIKEDIAGLLFMVANLQMEGIV